jgi:hypothetical protein
MTGMQNKTQKQPYKAPKIDEVGSVVERTLGESTGVQLDAAFPVGTPATDLTFS